MAEVEYNDLSIRCSYRLDYRELIIIFKFISNLIAIFNYLITTFQHVTRAQQWLRERGAIHIVLTDQMYRVQQVR